MRATDPRPRLSAATLRHRNPGVATPSYDRGQITPGIVHLGVGAFHRAHQAVYVDDCLAAGETCWGIVAASLRSRETRVALAPQDCLYTLALRETDHEHLRVVGSIQEVVVAPEDPERLLAFLTSPATRLVTLTITEKGYLADLTTGDLLGDHPDVIRDLENPAFPRTALGFLAEAIARRRANGVAPFTLLSCDNLPRNGRTLHRALTSFARARARDLGAYVADTIVCPSSMVDRIVPATTAQDRVAIGARLGIDDAWPVIGEPFGQWVVEDRFPGGRPSLETAGVQFVGDVAPYEHMKLRLLNGAHSAIAAMGRLAGLDTVAEAIRHPAVRGFVERYWAQVIPTLTLRQDDAAAYTRQLLRRFENVALHHRMEQIATDASQKIPQRILAPLRELLSVAAPHDALVFAVAAWIRSCCGHADSGSALPLNDPVFQAWAGQPDQRITPARDTVRAFLGLSVVFGVDLPRNEAFVAALAAEVEAIRRHGVIEATFRRLAQ